jgi:hypothetical protein
MLREENMQVYRRAVSILWLVPVAAALLGQGARADNFAKVHYDVKADELVVTMSYRGTNPDHNFTLKWGECLANQAGNIPSVTVEVLDDQFRDRAQQPYKKTTRFGLSEMPCARPASITLRTAPHYVYTLTIPG